MGKVCEKTERSGYVGWKYLGHDREESVLPEVGRLAAHVRTSEQHQAEVRVEGKVVRGEGNGGLTSFDQEMSAIFDLEYWKELLRWNGGGAMIG